MKNGFSNKIFDSIERLEVKLWWELLRKNKSIKLLVLEPKA